MKVLILGASGLVGHSLWRFWKSQGWDVVGTYLRHPLPELQKVDTLVPGEAEKLIEAEKPQAVVVTSSNPFVDYCEMHSVETRKLNIDATLRLAEAAKRARIKLVFFSTDYIFDGEKGRPYVEQDAPRPQNEYGRQKLMTEAGIIRLWSNHLILRISGVFGWEFQNKNFVLQLLDQTKKSPIKVADDLSSNPTYAPDIGPSLAELLERDAKGVFHLAGSETLSKYDFGRRVVEIFSLESQRIVGAKSDDLSPVRRPRCSALDTSKLMGIVRNPPLSATRGLEAMKDCAEEWKSYVASLAAA